MYKNVCYPAVIEIGEDSGYGLYFPDLAGTAALHSRTDDLLKDAKDVMIEALIMILVDDRSELPIPSKPHEIKLNSPSDIIVYLTANLEPYLDKAKNKAVTINCTVPYWMREAARDRNLNVSAILQKALKEIILD